MPHNATDMTRKTQFQIIMRANFANRSPARLTSTVVRRGPSALPPGGAGRATNDSGPKHYHPEPSPHVMPGAPKPRRAQGARTALCDRPSGAACPTGGGNSDNPPRGRHTCQPPTLSQSQWHCRFKEYGRRRAHTHMCDKTLPDTADATLRRMAPARASMSKESGNERRCDKRRSYRWIPDARRCNAQAEPGTHAPADKSWGKCFNIYCRGLPVQHKPAAVFAFGVPACWAKCGADITTHHHAKRRC